ncbi:hypothetical protein GQ55_1G119700 [Panicum hallii var. hallii]|uniref:Uncharacterized protein n=1 Tax=Panicum hallii var. hallii TaxID=1504633 RepID=A0A2T7F4T8_9POAL|nr:hypothetical protein GQ55_1G119700 [Panicum hallii var. hallii]
MERVRGGMDSQSRRARAAAALDEVRDLGARVWGCCVASAAVESRDNWDLRENISCQGMLSRCVISVMN